MSMNEYLKSVERSLGFSLPHELIELYRAAGSLGTNYNFIFDTRSKAAHWLANASYFLICPDDTNSSGRGPYLIDDFYVGEGQNILKTVNDKVGWSIKETWQDDKIFAFGWSCEVVEKDASLVYVFNKKGGVRGVYIHSLNFAEEKIFIANSLSEAFDLTFENATHSSTTISFRAKSSGGNSSSFENVLSGAYQIFDLETIDDVTDYKYWLQAMSKLSEKKFHPTLMAAIERDSKRYLEVDVGGKQHTVSLWGDTDLADLEIVEFANRCLLDLGHARKKFVVFTDSTFGQEVAIAFISNSKLKQLSKVKTVEILNG